MLYLYGYPVFVSMATMGLTGRHPHIADSLMVDYMLNAWNVRDECGTYYAS